VSVGIQQVPWPRGIEADAQVLEQSLQLMFLKERPGSFHLFVAAGTEFDCGPTWLLGG